MDLFLPEIYTPGSTKAPFGGVQAIYKPIKLAARKRNPELEDEYRLVQRESTSIVEILDSETQAKRLHNALHSIDADSNSIISILSNLSQYQRTRILHYYKTLYGRKLSVDIKDILGGDFGDACLCIISDPKVYLTKYINNLLVEFPYPKEEKLISVLSERTNEEIQVIQETYEKKFGKTLDKSFTQYLDAEAAKFIKILVNPLRQEDWTLNSLQAHIDAQNLLNLGIGVSYGDSSFPIIYSLLRKRGFRHLRNVFLEYERLTRNKIWTKLEPAMNGATRRRLVLIMEAVNNPGLYTAKVLHKSINCFDEFFETLLCIRLSRSKEFYKAVEHNFTEFYGRRISDIIRKEVHGEYRSLLLSLIDF